MTNKKLSDAESPDTRRNVLSENKAVLCNHEKTLNATICT